MNDEIDGIDELELTNTPIEELETEDVNLIFLGIDVSGSMQQYETIMRDELTKFKTAITNSKEAPRILVARADFSDFLNIGGYKKIEEFDTDYKTYNTTQMYDTIVNGSKKLREYMKYLREQGMRVRAVFAIFSDGYDNASSFSAGETRDTVEFLNSDEIVTAFVAFGADALTEGKTLQFKNVLEVGKSESELRKAFNQLSKSVISHSKQVDGTQDGFFQM